MVGRKVASKKCAQQCLYFYLAMSIQLTAFSTVMLSGRANSALHWYIMLVLCAL